jgi:flagellar assembly protein FliH
MTEPPNSQQRKPDLSKIIKANQLNNQEIKSWNPLPGSAFADSMFKHAKAHALDHTLEMQDSAAHAQAGAQQALEKIAMAESEAQEIKQGALDKGLSEGRMQAKKELEQSLAALLKVKEEVDVERSAFFDRMEPEVARLAVTIAEKVIAKELEAHPEVVIDLVKSALRRIREREVLRVRINPEDIPLVRAARDDMMSEISGIQKLDLIDDRRVGRGGCVVESSTGILDARIKTQLEQIERVISEAAGHGKASEGERSVKVSVAGEQNRLHEVEWEHSTGSGGGGGISGTGGEDRGGLQDRSGPQQETDPGGSSGIQG